MPNKLERFTQRARRVLSFAQEHAERLNHPRISTGHVLLGMLREEGGAAVRVLHHLKLDAVQVERLVIELTGDVSRKPGETLDLGSGTRKLLELAVDEARKLGHHYIGTEHLLLGMIRQPEGIATEVFRRIGVSADEVRRETMHVLQDPTIPTPEPAIPDSTPTIPIPDPAAAPEASEETHRTGAITYSRPLQQVLRLATIEASSAGRTTVDMEHLLLALMRRYDSLATTILKHFGLSPEEMRQEILTSLSVSLREANASITREAPEVRTGESRYAEPRHIEPRPGEASSGETSATAESPHPPQPAPAASGSAGPPAGEVKTAPLSIMGMDEDDDDPDLDNDATSPSNPFKPRGPDAR